MWSLRCLETWEQVTKRSKGCPAFGGEFLNDPSGTVARDSFMTSVLGASEILLSQGFAHQDSQGNAASSLGTPAYLTWLHAPCPSLRLRQLCGLCMCLFRLRFWNNDYTIYVWPPDHNHSKEFRKRFLSALHMNVILRPKLKIQLYVHTPYSLLHNGLACALPPSPSGPDKSAVHLCHVTFALSW